MKWLKNFWKALTAPSSGSGETGSKPGEGGEGPAKLPTGPETTLNFTPRAQKALAFAHEEAARMHHHFVGTEHVLLGLIRLGNGTAVGVLRNLGLDLETVRLEIEKQVGTGPAQKIVGNPPYTPRVKKVLALAAKEAKSLNHTYVGTEHILLGLLHEGDGVAARVLRAKNIDVEETRQEILKELAPRHHSPSENINTPKKSHNMDATKSPLEPIDTNKRYDVYSSERNQQVVVYRNARFKGRRKLLSAREHDIGGEFLELEQSNGQNIYLSLMSVIKFCEHGSESMGEIVSPK